MTFDYSRITDVHVQGIDARDYPDFCDAYISAAHYDQRPMTDEELEALNGDGAFVHSAAWNQLH